MAASRSPASQDGALGPCHEILPLLNYHEVWQLLLFLIEKSLQTGLTAVEERPFWRSLLQLGPDYGPVHELSG